MNENAIFGALFFGVIEGITEFLPISSTGHLILVNQWLGGFLCNLEDDPFIVLIQLGAVLAVVVVFWKELFPFSRKITVQERHNVYDLWGKALVGFFPTGVAAFFLSDWVKSFLFTPEVVAWALIFYGCLFLVVEKFHRKERFDNIQALTYPVALAIGVIQILALVPGTSRSGVTIIGAMLLGCSRMVATKYTFFLALPTMSAAAFYSLYKGVKEQPELLTSDAMLVLLVGFVTAFLVAWAVVKGFIRFISRHTFVPFGLYRIVLGLVMLALPGTR